MKARLPFAAVVLGAGALLPFAACGGDDDEVAPVVVEDAFSNADRTTSDAAGDAPATDADAAGPRGPACRSSGWCWENPTPWGDHLTGVWGAAANDVWAVGWAGAIFHFDGTAWSRASSPTMSELNAVWGISPTNMWAVGTHGMILHGDGSSWTVQKIDDAGVFSGAIHGVHGTSGTDVWAVGDLGMILHYDGASWTSRPAADGGAAYNSWQSVYAHASGDVYLAGTGFGGESPLEHWDGQYWVNTFITPEDTGTPYAGDLSLVWVAPNGDVFAAGHEGGVGSWVFRRSGTTWTRASVPDVTSYEGMWGTSATDVWLVGSAGTIVHFDGAAWTPIAGGPGPAAAGGRRLEAVGGAGTDAWIVGEGATFLRRSSATSTTWTPSTAPAVTSITRKLLNDVAALSADEAWAVGGTVLHRTAQGWAIANALDDGGVLDDKMLSGVSALSTNDVWASGVDGAYHWDGAKWSQRSALAGGGNMTQLGDISAVSATDVWGVSGSAVYRYTAGAGGTPGTWAVVPLAQADGALVPTPPFLPTIVARSATDVWAGGPFTVLHYDGAGWKKLNEGDAGATVDGPASGVLPFGPNDAWVVTGFTKEAFHYDGMTFTAVAIPGDWSDSLIFPKMAASSPTDLWLVATGGIAHGNGASWTYSDRPSATLRGIGAANGHAWVVGDDGAILHHAP